MLRAPGTPVWPLHFKVDTGMHRVGCAPDDALVARTGDPRPPGAGARQRVDPRRRRRRASTTRSRPSSCGASRRSCARIGAESVPVPVRARRELGGQPSRIPRRAWISCGAASRSTGSRPLPRSRRSCPRLASARPCGCSRAVSLVKVVDAGERISYGLRHRFARDDRDRDRADRLRRRRPPFPRPRAVARC